MLTSQVVDRSMAFVILFWDEVRVLSVMAKTTSGLQDSVYERQSDGVTFG